MPRAGWDQAKEAPIHIHGIPWSSDCNLENKTTDYTQYEKWILHGIYVQ